MKKAVIYARFSSSKQREASIDDQVRVCHEWCDKRGYEVVNIYTDYAYSGRNDKRPAFQEMISNAGESDIVLVYMMDRFSRDIYDAPIYKKDLLNKGVKVVSATEELPDSEAAILFEHIYEAMAAMESANTAKRVKRGMQGNARKGMHNGNRVYGYNLEPDGSYSINEEQAAIVRRIFTAHIMGKSANAIAERLAKEGYKTNRGKPFSQNTVATILKNRKYTGRYEWGGTVIEDGMPAIISKDVFYLAEEVSPKRDVKTETWREYLLSGKADCGLCGAHLTGASAHGRKKRYDYYVCGGKCGLKRINADKLEGLISGAIKELLLDEENSLKVAEMLVYFAKQEDKDSERRLKAAKERQRQLHKERTAFIDAIGQGLKIPDLVERGNEIERACVEADKEVEKLQEVFEFNPVVVAEYLRMMAAIDDREILMSFVDFVIVYNDKVEVAINKSNELDIPNAATISLEPSVREPIQWWSISSETRTQIAYYHGEVWLSIPLVA